LTNDYAIKKITCAPSFYKPSPRVPTKREETSMEKKITCNDENGRPLGAISSLQADGQIDSTDYLYSTTY
jgi:hypothetical protein